jgi:hypothetical protein
LHAQAPQLVVGCLSEVQTALNEANWQNHEREGGPNRPRGPCPHSAVARFGDRSDLAGLRDVSRGHPFTRHAVAALKALDAVAG